MTKKPVVGIMGASLATGNRGVSALGSSLVKLFHDSVPQVEVVMLIASRDPKPFHLRIGIQDQRIPVVNFRVTPKSRPSKNLWFIFCLAFIYRGFPYKRLRGAICRFCPWIDCVANACVVGDIRGGDSFSDIYGSLRFAIASLPVITVILIRGNIALFPQTYGPFKSLSSRIIARYILQHSSPILTRDKESADSIRQLAGQRTNIEFCPDVAFSLEAHTPENVEVEPPFPKPANSRECLIGINVNGLMYNGGYTRNNMFGLKLDYHSFLRILLDSFLINPLNRVLLIPHTFAAAGNIENDTEASQALIKTLVNDPGRRLHLVVGEYDQHEIKSIIGKCDFFVGSRLHSCIAALSQNVPTVGVAYSKKFHGVFETVGAQNWVIDAREIDAATALKTVHLNFLERLEMHNTLSDRSAAVRELLKQHFAAFGKYFNS